MLDIKFIRENQDLIKKAIAAKKNKTGFGPFAGFG